MIDIIKDSVTAATDTKTTGKPHVVILLDASGSMASHRDSVVSTFNEYVRSIRETARTISLYTFDSNGIREKIFKESPARVRKLGKRDYAPDAMTPLYDAMGKVMEKFYDYKRNVQFVTHTDGQENDSKDWSFARLSEKIEILTARGWLFVYLGEGLQGKETMDGFRGLRVNFSPVTRGAAITSLESATALYSSTCSNSMEQYTAGGLVSPMGATVNVDEGEEVSTFVAAENSKILVPKTKQVDKG